MNTSNREQIEQAILSVRLCAQRYGADGVGTIPSRALIAALNEFANEVEHALNYEEPPYLEEEVIQVVRSFNPRYDQEAKCKCGHQYYRHFDWSDDDDPVGCKYCGCDTFELNEEAS